MSGDSVSKGDPVVGALTGNMGSGQKNPGTFFDAFGNFVSNPSLDTANSLMDTGDPAWRNTAGLTRKMMPQDPGSPSTAGAAPTPGASTMTALHAQLQQEINMRKMRTLFTGPSGIGGMSAGSVLGGRV